VDVVGGQNIKNESSRPG